MDDIDELEVPLLAVSGTSTRLFVHFCHKSDSGGPSFAQSRYLHFLNLHSLNLHSLNLHFLNLHYCNLHFLKLHRLTRHPCRSVSPRNAIFLDRRWPKTSKITKSMHRQSIFCHFFGPTVASQVAVGNRCPRGHRKSPLRGSRG